MKKETKVLILFYLAYVGIYVARLNLSMASPTLMEQNILTSVEIGFLGSAFSLIYSCGRLFNGIVADRAAPRLLIVTGLLLTGASNLLLGILPAYLLFLVLWSVNAFGQSMLWSSILRATSSLYGKARADKKVTILTTSIAAGNIVSIVLGTQTIARLGLRFAFLVPGVLTVLTGLAVAWVMRDVRVEKPDVRSGFPLFAMLKERSILVILTPALLHGAVKDNTSLWMAVYFLDHFGVDLENTAWFVLLIPTFGLLGRLAYPFLYKLVKGNEHTVSILSFVCSALVCIPLLLPGVTPLVATLCLSMLFAFISMINSSILSIFPLRFANKNMVASVSGLTDFATYLGAAIGSAIYGFWLEDGHYDRMFLSWIVLCILSVLILLLQYPIRKEEKNHV